MPYRVLADIILIVHLLYVIFAVGGEIAVLLGGFFKWKFIRKLSFRVIHLVSVIIVAIEASIGVICPLTEWEYQLRVLAGQYIEADMTFIGRIIRKVMFYNFPAWVFTLSYILFAILVVITLITLPPEKKNRR